MHGQGCQRPHFQLPVKHDTFYKYSIRRQQTCIKTEQQTIIKVCCTLDWMLVDYLLLPKKARKGIFVKTLYPLKTGKLNPNRQLDMVNTLATYTCRVQHTLHHVMRATCLVHLALQVVETTADDNSQKRITMQYLNVDNGLTKVRNDWRNAIGATLAHKKAQKFTTDAPLVRCSRMKSGEKFNRPRIQHLI